MAIFSNVNFTELFLKFILWWTPVRRLRTQDHFDRMGLFYVGILFAGFFNFIGGCYDFNTGFYIGSFLSLSTPIISVILFFLIRSSIPTYILEHTFIITILIQLCIELTFSHGASSPYLHYAVFPAGYFFLLHQIRQGIIALLYTLIFVPLGIWFSTIVPHSDLIMTPVQKEYFEPVFYASHLMIMVMFYFCFNVISAESRKYRTVSGNLIAGQRENIEQFEIKMLNMESHLAEVEVELLGYKDNTEYLMNESTTSLRKKVERQELEIDDLKNFDSKLYKQILNQSADIVNNSEVFLQNNTSDEVQKFLNKVKDKSDTLSSLVIQAAEFRKVTAHQTSSSDFDIRQLVDSCFENVLQGHNQLFLNHINQIDYRIPRFLFGHPDKLSKILTNIIHHSYCITPKGFIQLQIFLESHVENEYKLHFRLRDSGLVLNKEQSKKIFEPFASLDLYPSFVNQLNGLELSLAKKWIKEIDGELTYNYHASLGNTLSFTIPFSTSILNEEFVNDINLDKEQTFFPNIQCAIINENKVSTGIIEKNLRKWDVIYRSTQNPSGLDELLHHQDYDLIFWDSKSNNEIISKLNDYKLSHPNTKIVILPAGEEPTLEAEDISDDWIILGEYPNEQIIFDCLCSVKPS